MSLLHAVPGGGWRRGEGTEKEAELKPAVGIAGVSPPSPAHGDTQVTTLTSRRPACPRCG